MSCANCYGSACADCHRRAVREVELTQDLEYRTRPRVAVAAVLAHSQGADWDCVVRGDE